MAKGWIKLSRELQDHWIWKGEPFDKRSAWIDLLLLANYEDKKTTYKGEVVVCKRGDVNLSVSFLANRWGWSRHKVSDFLNILESDNMISQNRTVRRTVITIVNYKAFQAIGDSKKDSSRTDKGQIADTTKKDKEINKNNIRAFNTFQKTSYDMEEIEKALTEVSK